MHLTYEDKSKHNDKIIGLDTDIKDLLLLIERTKIKTFFVIDQNDKLIGVVSEGDVRRYFISYGFIPDKIEVLINRNPVKYSDEELINLTHIKFVWENSKIPVVDKENTLIGFFPNSKSDMALKSKDRVSIIAPTRVTFAGGGSDVGYWFAKNDGCVLNLAIAKYARVNISRNFSSNVNIKSLNTKEKLQIDLHEIKSYDKSILKLVINCLKVCNITDGLDIEIYCDFDPGTGLGGSSSLVIAIVKGITTLFGIEISQRQLIKIAYTIEREKTGISGGWQDQIISAYGGLCFTEFSNNGFNTKKIQLESEHIDNLNSCLFITKVGNTRSSDQIHRKQETHKADMGYIENLSNIVKLARECSRDFCNGNIFTLGETLHKGWVLKRNLGDFISNETVDNCYDKLISFGALGGRLLGAGGAGYLLVLVPQNNQIKFLKSCKMENIALERLQIDTQGVREI